VPRQKKKIWGSEPLFAAMPHIVKLLCPLLSLMRYSIDCESVWLKLQPGYLAHNEVSGLVDEAAVRAVEDNGRERQDCSHQYDVVHVWTRHFDVSVTCIHAH